MFWLLIRATARPASPGVAKLVPSVERSVRTGGTFAASGVANISLGATLPRSVRVQDSRTSSQFPASRRASVHPAMLQTSIEARV